MRNNSFKSFINQSVEGLESEYNVSPYSKLYERDKLVQIINTEKNVSDVKGCK